MRLTSIFSLSLVILLSFSFAQESQAKRFGSGGFGKSFSTSPFKKAPASTPAKPNKSADKNQAQPAANQGRKGGMMGGLMGGLLAGGLFAYLLGSGAFEGLQFMDILLFGLIGFILFKLFTAGRAQTAGAHNQYFQGQSSAPMTSGNSATGAIPMDLPSGLDVAGFTSRAVEHFKMVHDAWDKGNMDLVAEYLAPELLDELTQERASQASKMSHEVLDLTAEIVRSETQSNGHILSVLFRGRMRDTLAGEEMGVFDVWHLQQRDNGPWLIIGIEAQ